MKLPALILAAVALLSARPLWAATDPFTDQAPFPLGALGATVSQTQGSSAMKVATVTSGSPASAAGLLVDDFIYGVNGERLSLPGNPHHDAWRTTGSELGIAIERSETTTGELSLMVLRHGVGPLTLTATLPLTTPWQPSFPVGDLRMAAYYEQVCADIHTKIQAADFFEAFSSTTAGGDSDYYGAYYGMILLAHPNWNSTTGAQPYRNSINKIRDRAIAYLNTRILEPVQPGVAGYVDAGFDNWNTTAHAMFLGEYRRKSGDVAVNAAVQNATLVLANRIQDTRGSIMGHGGVALVHAYNGGGLNIINANAMLAMAILRGAGANFSAVAGASGLTIEQKFQANWARLKSSTNLYNGTDEESKNEDGNVSYVNSFASGRVSDGVGGGWDSNARTPCTAVGYQIYLNTGGTAATADDTDKLNRMKAYTPRNWQRQHNNHGYAAPGTVFSQMLMPFLSDRQQSFFRENSRIFFTLSRDHSGAVLYFPGRNNLQFGDVVLGFDNVRYLMPGMAWAVASGNLPSFPQPAGAANRIYVKMNSPRNDWPSIDARRVKVVGVTHNLDLDVTNYLGATIPSGFTASWSKISGPSVTIANPNALDTGVVFSALGSYRLQLTVTAAGTPGITELYDFEIGNQVGPPSTTASIAQQPVSRICAPGDSAFFSVAVNGIGPFVYQWKLNDTNFGAPSTSPVLSIPNASKSHFGTYRCSVTYPGGVLTTANALLCPSGTYGILPGGLKLERWNGLGSSVAALTGSSRYPSFPDVTATVPEAEAQPEQGENFGERLSGWLIPPTSGTYQFFLAADNAAELWLSTDNDPANKVKLKSVGVAGYRQYSMGPSTEVDLFAGNRYYIEVLHVESGFDDFCSIAWKKPGDAVPADGSSPIPGAFLESEQLIPESSYSGLLSHWRLDEGTGALAVDSMATGNEASITGATWTTGRHDGALQFDGINDRVFCASSAAMGGLMAFTVSAWVKLDAPAAAGVIIQQRPTDGLPPQFSESGQYQLGVTAAGTASFFCSGHSSMAFNFTGLKNLNDGQWHHVAGVREANGDGLIYVDGAVDASATSSGYIWPLDPANSVGIGADVSNGSAYFKGSLDDVRIYNRALTSPETSALAQSSFTRGWSRAPWTGDASTGINLGSAWAYHFGADTNTAIQGRKVGGLTGTSPAIGGRFSIKGTTAALPIDTNNLTTQTGTAAAVIGKNFIWGANPATVTIQGLTVGNNYVVTFLSCGWEAAGGRQMQFSSSGQTLNVDQDEYGNNNGIRIDYAFTADAASRVITVTPVTANTSFHFYALALRDAGADTVKSGALWTGDSTAGMLPSSAWAYHFGSGTSATIGGQTVPGIAGTNPAVADKFSITGMGSVYNGDANDLTSTGGSGSAVLGANFIYGGAPATITLQGLLAGRKYVATLLTVGWEAAGGRQVVVSSGSDRFVVDQGQFGNNRGNRIDYPFTADAATRVITIAPSFLTPANSFHLYGLALRQGSIVTNDCDFGPNSLRQTLADAALIPGADTLTPDPALEGITLTPASELLATGAAPITVDATNLQGGLTLTGGDSNRLFRVAAGTTLDLRRLTLTHGRTSGAFPGGYGGAIFSQGPLNLTECTLSDCSATTAGGAIAALNSVEVTATRCALLNNSASYGGAVQNEASFIALTSTFAGNRATLVGGAISAPFGRSTLLKHCTLSTNWAGTSGGAYDGTGLLIENTIAAGNTAPIGPNINGAIAGLGPANLLSDSPQLFPLANYGGFTATMPPLPGSPARNAAASSLISEPIDQRGFAREATPDIGAAEYLSSDFPAPYWLDDWDQDGTANGVELALGTDPTLADPSSAKNLKIIHQPNGINVLTFGYNSALAGQARWVLKSSQNLTTWDDVFVWDGSLHFFGDTTGGLSGSTFTIRNARPGTRLFYRFEAEAGP